MFRGKKLRVAALCAGVVSLSMVAWGGVAMAVSGPYQPPQQDCPWNSDAWNTPNNETYPGCHSIAVNVESGSTTNGQANADNTRYVEYGDDQNGIDPNSKGTPTVLSLGQPGNTGAPHAGCLSANTDGTNQTPDPQNSSANDTPQQSGPATEDSPYGCGNNPNGLGFEANYDWFAVYCPIAQMAGMPCEDPSPPGNNSFTPDTGTGVNYEPIVQNGLLLYFGMDDNADNGEHDGFDGCAPGTVAQRCAGTGQGCPTAGETGYNSATCNPAGQTNTATDGAINGPSDGGAMVLAITPQWLLAPTTPSQTHPEGLVNYESGFCADGICAGLVTQQTTIYYGCIPSGGGGNTENGTDGATSPQNNQANDQCAPGTAPSTDAYQDNTPSSQDESANCNSGGPYASAVGGTEQPCFTNVNGSPNGSPNTTSGNGGANSYRQNTPSQVNDEPGVQIYQDPDPQRSPAAPFATPGAYVGSCGVYANDTGGYGEPGATEYITSLGGNAPTGQTPPVVDETQC